MERPWMKFCGRDWLADLDLARCTMAARGLWIAMLALMHEGNPYGHLADKRGPISPKTLSEIQHITAGQCQKLLSDLEENSVFSRTEAGVIFSRRMVRDENVRLSRAAGGYLGGNPKLTEKDNLTVILEGLPSPRARTSDSDSDSSGTEKKNVREIEIRQRFNTLAKKHPSVSRYEACWSEYLQIVTTAFNPERTMDLLDASLARWVKYWRAAKRIPMGLFNWLHDGDCFHNPPELSANSEETGVSPYREAVDE